MENQTFELFIQHCGFVKRVTQVLGLKREYLSAMRRGLIEVSLLYTLRIEKIYAGK